MINMPAQLTDTEIRHLIARHLHIPVESVTDRAPLEHLCKGNVYKLGLLLLDLCEYTDQPFTYSETEAFTQYPTVGSVIELFVKTSREGNTYE